MRESVESFENEGFEIKKDPIKTAPAKKARAVKQIEQPKQGKETIVAVVENRGVLAETQKSNKVMQLAVGEMLKAIKKVGGKPKKLICKNIERCPKGLMKSFEIEVLE